MKTRDIQNIIEPKMTSDELRLVLFAIDNQEMTVRELRQKLFAHVAGSAEFVINAMNIEYVESA